MWSMRVVYGSHDYVCTGLLFFAGLVIYLTTVPILSLRPILRSRMLLVNLCICTIFVVFRNYEHALLAIKLKFCSM